MMHGIASGFAPGRLSAPGTWGAVALDATRDTSGTLSLTTKEGDTFTLSASVDTEVTYAGVRGRTGGAFSASVSSSSSLTVAVQGDLSRAEWRDILHAVRRFMHDLRAAARGQDVSVANVGNGHAATLSDLSASLTSSTHVALAGGASPLGPPAPVAEAEDAVPVSDPSEFHTASGPDTVEG